MRARGRRRDGWRDSAARIALFMAVPALMGQATPVDEATQAAFAALVAGLGLFSALSGVAVLRARRRAATVQRDAQDEIRRLGERLARAEALNRFDDQIVVVWDEPGGPPRDLFGRMTTVAGVPDDMAGIVAFDRWLSPESAEALTAQVGALRMRGESFSTTLRTPRGDHLEAEGRCSGASVLLRFRDLSPERTELARIAARHAHLLRDVEALRALHAELPHPVWIREPSGALVWVNAAYAKALDAPDAATAVERRLEFLDADARSDVAAAMLQGRVWRRRITAVVAGARRTFEVVVTPVPRGSAGMAIDVSDAETGRKDLERIAAAHQRTLDNLPTPVAVFGADRRLVYHNAAWRDLWGLDQAFLAERPEEGQILDRLREKRRLPEQANYREWKAQHLEVYRSIEPRESWWHLPDGRTIRTYADPNPQGGVTIIQENATEVLDLKSRTAAYERTQRETIDALNDAVAVFGSDGRLKLSNPAFAAMWRLDARFLAGAPHVDAVIARMAALHEPVEDWARLKSAVFAIGEERNAMTATLDRGDGKVLDLAAVPMPDGATLVTFVDVTASVNVERMLQEKNDALGEKNAALAERNEALVAADRLKNAFVEHVSYQLRTPLTNVIGFADVLAGGAAGPLTEKQREYMGYIMSSSNALLAIINDILDLATIDAGTMQLDVARFDVAETIEAAVDGVRDRLGAEGIRLVIEVPPEIGAMTADAKRIRQILHNLLSNAIGFSERGQTIVLAAQREADGTIVFTVTDRGRGIEPDRLARVFDRFETEPGGTRHRGVGLGLSLVRSFVQLHGGSVEIASTPGQGTSVTCRFPPLRLAAPASARTA